MTIAAWVEFIILAITILGAGLMCAFFFDGYVGKCVSVIVSIVLTILLYCGFNWYFTSTASGKRAMIDQRSELNNGLNRVVTIYTADGNILAEYKGNIDIEANDGGYVIFDYDGKRYMYYNCFVESIADIGG
uniref:Uncharacterized protein n=1 Tax=Siphoviridae sp. ct9lR64 TaxID=2826178 RepID=A0A8S5QYL1_9CAUD|nr:MAG TPA: protein of unknown function (DUF5052) [Siphoviridae sp. ct9lR64]